MSESNVHISVVVPLYRCSECIPELHRRLTESLSKLTSDFEIILVNDASPDSDWEIVCGLADEDKRVKGVNLARNFGQHFAITAGLDVADGDWVVVMDGDLQDRPEEIETLYRKAQEGDDIVFGMMDERQDRFLKKLASRAFGVVYNFLSEVKIRPAISNFSISSRQVIENYRRVRERSRSFALIIIWLGFKIGYATVQHSARHAGTTTYTLRKSVNFAIDSLTSQSSRPLRLSMVFGFGISALSALFGIYLIARQLIIGIPVLGWASVMVSIYFIGGLLFANLGVIGIYLGKVFDEAKGRPLYIVRETRNFHQSQGRED
jgi:polyisoprenyl-phosphate glycosyltransferase